MTKKGVATIETIIALLLVVFVVVAIISYGPRIWELINAAIGFAKFESEDTKNINQEKSAPVQQKIEIEGMLGEALVIKMEDQFYQQRPTSPDYCLVVTNVKNTGKVKWSESDKIRVTLYCKQFKNQASNLIQVQNFPISGYVKNLEPGKDIQVVFAGLNNCLESAEKYYIVLYSNCQGDGDKYQPCDNTDVKKMDEKPFNCPVS